MSFGGPHKNLRATDEDGARRSSPGAVPGAKVAPPLASSPGPASTNVRATLSSRSSLMGARPAQPAVLDIFDRRLVDMQAARAQGLLDRVPPAPPTGFRLYSLLRQPKLHMGDVIEIVRCDAKLTARLLRLSNSALLGARQEVASVEGAIERLGVRMLSEQVTASGAGDLLSLSRDAAYIDPFALWQHSLASAVAATHVSSMIRDDDTAVETCFTAGLLHDLGKSLLNGLKRPEVKRIREFRGAGMPPEEAELLALGMNHAEFGAYVLDRWSLPKELVDAVRFHPAPPPGRPSLAMVVHVASACAHIAVEGGGDAREISRTLLADDLSALFLAPEAFEGIVAQVRDEVRAVESRLLVAEI